jgi:hypothetical protein
MSVQDRHPGGHRGRNTRWGHPSGARPSMGGTALRKGEARRSSWTPPRRMVSGPHGLERGSMVGRKGVGPRSCSARATAFGVLSVEARTLPLQRAPDASWRRISLPPRVRELEATGPKSRERCRVQPVQPPFRVPESRQLALLLSSEGGRSRCMCLPAKARGRGSPAPGVRTPPSDAPGYERRRTRPGCQTAGPPPTQR